MASGTARALAGGEALRAGRKVDRTRILDAWAVDSLTLETRLRAYFGGKIVTAWEIYSWLVDRWDGRHSAGQAEAQLITATTPPIHLDSGASDAIASAFFISDHSSLGHPFEASPRLIYERTAVARLRGYLRPYLRQKQYRSQSGPVGPFVAEFGLLRIQAEMAREIARAHAAGYSTNAHDLLHDLIP